MKNIRPTSTTYQGFRVLVLAGLISSLLSVVDITYITFTPYMFYFYLVACAVFMVYTGKEAFVKDSINKFKGGIDEPQ